MSNEPFDPADFVLGGKKPEPEVEYVPMANRKHIIASLERIRDSLPEKESQRHFLFAAIRRDCDLPKLCKVTVLDWLGDESYEVTVQQAEAIAKSLSLSLAQLIRFGDNSKSVQTRAFEAAKKLSDYHREPESP